MSDHKKIFLAPKCCDGGEGRLWCQDNVWPCNDCPEPSKAVPSVYRLDQEAVDALASEMAQDAQLEAAE